MARHKIPKRVKQAVRDKYAWPGGYPLFIVFSDGGVMHPDCARSNWRQIAESTVRNDGSGWRVCGADINYEDDSLYCDDCGKPIRAAYAD